MEPFDFWAFIGGVVLVISLFFLGMLVPAFFYLFVVALFIVVFAVFFVTSVKKYNQFERGIIFRLGKFNRVAGPGWAVVIPFFEEQYKKVDVRVRMLDMNCQDVFTQDDIKVALDGTIYYQIVDPEKATLQIDNYGQGLTTLVHSAIRNAIASISMRQLFGSLDTLNDVLANAIRHMTWKWGIDVPTVQIRSIAPSPEVIQAMQQPEIAANLLQAQRFKADAQKIVIEAIGEGAKALDDRSIMYLYLEALKQMGESSSSKIVLPMQFMQPGGALGGLAGLSAAALASLGGQENVQNVISEIKDKINQSVKSK